MTDTPTVSQAIEEWLDDQSLAHQIITGPAAGAGSTVDVSGDGSVVVPTMAKVAADGQTAFTTAIETAQGEFETIEEEATALLTTLGDVGVGFRPVSTTKTTPVGDEIAGARYLVAAAGTSGAFAGHAKAVAQFDGAQWLFAMPAAGQTLFVQDTGVTYKYLGGSWLAWNEPGAISTKRCYSSAPEFAGLTTAQLVTLVTDLGGTLVLEGDYAIPSENYHITCPVEFAGGRFLRAHLDFTFDQRVSGPDDIAWFDQTLTSVVTFTVPPRVFNPQMFGGTNDKDFDTGYDSHDAIQEFFNVLYYHGGTGVMRGNYYWSGAQIDTAMQEGKKWSVDGYGCTIRAGGAVYALKVVQNVANYGAVIKGLSFDATDSAAAANLGGLWCHGCIHTAFEDINIIVDGTIVTPPAYKSVFMDANGANGCYWTTFTRLNVVEITSTFITQAVFIQDNCNSVKFKDSTLAGFTYGFLLCDFNTGLGGPNGVLIDGVSIDGCDVLCYFVSASANFIAGTMVYNYRYEPHKNPAYLFKAAGGVTPTNGYPTVIFNHSFETYPGTFAIWDPASPSGILYREDGNSLATT